VTTTEHPLRPQSERTDPPRRRRGRGGSRPPEHQGRRLQPAGYAFLILLGAALVASLLNAQGLRKTAFNMEPGPGRDLAMALTKPLVEVSAFLHLDSPRAEIQEAIGRGGADVIDTAVVLPAVPTTEAPPGETNAAAAAPEIVGAPGVDTTAAPPIEGNPGTGEASAPPLPAFTPKKKLKVWIGGDSLAITPGQSLTRILGATKVVKTVAPVDGRLSTGLERPDVFNWFTYIPQEIRRLDPDVVVLTFGANDDHGYMTGLPEGVEVDDFATEAWVKEYRRRVGGLMDAASRDGRMVVWIGIPITRSPEQTNRYRVLNTIYQTEAEKRPERVIYINAYRMFRDENGDYADYLPNASGKLIQVRAPDGVHYQPEGGDLIAREILRRLKEVYDLTSWKTERS
jgi:hypothetical protein